MNIKIILKIVSFVVVTFTVSFLLLKKKVSSDVLKEITASQKKSLKSLNAVIDRDIQRLEDDIHFLSKRVRGKSFPLTERALSELEQEAKDFYDLRSVYDQIRFLNLEGKELWRVDQNGVRPSNQLQDKSDRYYYSEAIESKKSSLILF